VIIVRGKHETLTCPVRCIQLTKLEYLDVSLREQTTELQPVVCGETNPIERDWLRQRMLYFAECGLKDETILRGVAKVRCDKDVDTDSYLCLFVMEDPVGTVHPKLYPVISLLEGLGSLLDTFN
jgi:hypothetical protein